MRQNGSFRYTCFHAPYQAMTEYHYFTLPCRLNWPQRQILDRVVLAFTLTITQPNPKTLRIGVDLVFHPLRIVRRGLAGYLFYVATDSADVRIEAHSGQVTSCTQSRSISVKYNVSEKKTGGRTATLAPKGKFKGSAVELEYELASLSNAQAAEFASSASFDASEQVIALEHLGYEARWSIVPMKGVKITNPYYQGNVPLFADCNWNAAISGLVGIEPGVILFFGNQRNSVGKLKSLVMECVLRMRGKALKHLDGLSIPFKV